MNRWLAVLFIVGVFGGAAQGAYPAVLIGGNTLTSLASGLGSISSAASSFYSMAVSTRTTILASGPALVANVNNTYVALNKTYGNNPLYTQALQLGLDAAQSVNRLVNYGDQAVAMFIGQLIQPFATSTNTFMDTLFGSYSSMLYPSNQGSNYSNCVINNATTLQAANVSIARFAYCLSNQTAIVTSMIPIANAFLPYVQAEFNRLASQSTICSTAAAGSTSMACMDYYMSTLNQETSTLGYVLNPASSFGPDAYEIMQQALRFCIKLTSQDITDILQAVYNNISGCQSLSARWDTD